MLVLCVNSPFEFSTMPMFCKREVASWSYSEFLCSLCLYLGKKKALPYDNAYLLCEMLFLIPVPSISEISGACALAFSHVL